MSNQLNKIEPVKELLQSIFIDLKKPKLKNYLKNFEKDATFFTEINKKIKSNLIFKKKNFQSIYEFSVYRNFIYNLIRNTKPNVIIETGVLHGLTSAWILNAINDNGSGKLISIDLPRRDWKKYFGDKNFGPGGQAEFEIENEKPGWIIPDYLRKNWEFYQGSSEEHLPTIIKKYNKVDLFIHDSDHSYNVMSYECDLISNNYKNIDIIIDDHYCNQYYLDYSKKFSRNFFLVDDIDDSYKQVPGCVYFPKIDS